MNRHTEPDAKEILRRKVSQSHEPGADPYNTADTIRISQQLSADLVDWAFGGSNMKLNSKRTK